jgi:NADPH2:quinone reductase
MLAFKQGNKVGLILGLVHQKNLWITGSRRRPRPIAEKGRLAATIRWSVLPLIENGDIRPVIDSTYPLRAAHDAHRRMEAGGHDSQVPPTV